MTKMLNKNITQLDENVVVEYLSNLRLEKELLNIKAKNSWGKSSSDLNLKCENMKLSVWKLKGEKFFAMYYKKS